MTALPQKIPTDRAKFAFIIQNQPANLDMLYDRIDDLDLSLVFQFQGIDVPFLQHFEDRLTPQNLRVALEYQEVPFSYVNGLPPSLMTEECWRTWLKYQHYTEDNILDIIDTKLLDNQGIPFKEIWTRIHYSEPFYIGYATPLTDEKTFTYNQAVFWDVEFLFRLMSNTSYYDPSLGNLPIDWEQVSSRFQFSQEFNGITDVPLAYWSWISPWVNPQTLIRYQDLSEEFVMANYGEFYGPDIAQGNIRITNENLKKINDSYPDNVEVTHRPDNIDFELRATDARTRLKQDNWTIRGGQVEGIILCYRNGRTVDGLTQVYDPETKQLSTELNRMFNDLDSESPISVGLRVIREDEYRRMKDRRRYVPVLVDVSIDDRKIGTPADGSITPSTFSSHIDGDSYTLTDGLRDQTVVFDLNRQAIATNIQHVNINRKFRVVGESETTMSLYDLTNNVKLLDAIAYPLVDTPISLGGVPIGVEFRFGSSSHTINDTWEFDIESGLVRNLRYLGPGSNNDIILSQPSAYDSSGDPPNNPIFDQVPDYIKFSPSLDFVTGRRVKIISNFVPSPLQKDVWYYAIKINSTTMQLADSLANANDGFPIDLTDASLKPDKVEIELESTIIDLDLHVDLTGGFSSKEDMASSIERLFSNCQLMQTSSGFTQTPKRWVDNTVDISGVESRGTIRYAWSTDVQEGDAAILDGEFVRVDVGHSPIFKGCQCTLRWDGTITTTRRLEPIGFDPNNNQLYRIVDDSGDPVTIPSLTSVPEKPAAVILTQTILLVESQNGIPFSSGDIFDLSADFTSGSSGTVSRVSDVLELDIPSVINGTVYLKTRNDSYGASKANRDITVATSRKGSFRTTGMSGASEPRINPLARGVATVCDGTPNLRAFTAKNLRWYPTDRW